MDCPGEYLKRERKLREVSLDDISREIKVPVKLLKALEEDDYPSLPHTAFVKGFIRAYCKFLGVDENDALLRYELYLQEIAEFEEPLKSPKSLDVEERSYPVRKYLTLTLVAVGIIIIAGVYYLTSVPDDTVDNDKPLSVESTKEEVPPAVTKVEEKVERKMAKAAIERKERRVEKTVKAESPKKVESAAKSQEPAKSEEKRVVAKPPVKEAIKIVSLPALKSSDLDNMGLAPGEHVLRAYAKALTWMKVTVDKNEPFEIMLQPGQRAEWRGKVFFCS